MNRQQKTARLAQPGLNCSQTGSSMIEVMVALVVLAVGLLGLAMLQIKSTRINTESSQNTQATLLANDIIEKMRANPRGNYGIDPLPTASLGCTAKAAGGTTFCTPDERAKDDLYDWNLMIHRMLGPRGSGGIVKNVNSYTIIISWKEMRANSDSTNLDDMNKPITDLVTNNRTWVIEI